MFRVMSIGPKTFMVKFSPDNKVGADVIDCLFQSYKSCFDRCKLGDNIMALHVVREILKEAGLITEER